MSLCNRVAFMASAGLALGLVFSGGCGASSDEVSAGESPAGVDPGYDYSLGELMGKVVINGQELGEAELRDFGARYGVGPRPGRYWYDGKSGLFGAEGGPSLGWIMPGHAFGTLSAKASNGTTGVFINGRELDAVDYSTLSRIAGTMILPGRYWLDGQGNVGYEGVDFPVGNLYLAARMQASAGSGGDNAWATRFAGGNSNADNSEGFVQCPDGTFVSYGF